MKIGIGSDHKGHLLKANIIKDINKSIEDTSIEDTSIEWIDVGTDSNNRVNYPIFAKRVCDLIISGDLDKGILICGSGIGMSIAANRYKNIFAALCWSPEVAKLARKHDLANILVLPADFIDNSVAFKIINTWLETEFESGVYKERLDQIDR